MFAHAHIKTLLLKKEENLETIIKFIPLFQGEVSEGRRGF